MSVLYKSFCLDCSWKRTGWDAHDLGHRHVDGCNHTVVMTAETFDDREGDYYYEDEKENKEAEENHADGFDGCDGSVSGGRVPEDGRL